VIHTSSHEIGQIYIPGVNWILMLCTIGLVLGFHTSDNLAAAYGVAVTATMIITTILAFIVARRLWHWPLAVALLVTAAFLAVDLAFFGANIVKVADGGWFPLVVGLVVYTLMSTWHKGREQIAAELSRGALPFDEFANHLRPGSPIRVPGAAIFMSRDSISTPTALLHNLKHNKVLHEKVVLLSIVNEEIPQVPNKERVRLEDLGKGFYRLTARYGFMENPSVPEVLELARAKGIDLPPMSSTFFLSRETLIPSQRKVFSRWREQLFAVMVRNAVRPTDFFRIPPNRVIELGMQVKL
jgi:KUP system potassium uptake protein